MWRRINAGQVKVVIGARTNLQDLSCVHVTTNWADAVIGADVRIGRGTVIGANAVMAKRSLNIKGGDIHIIIDKPIDVTSYTLEKRDELIAKVRNTVIKNFEAYGSDPSPSNIKAGLFQ